jgi:tetratricopeptide (TPR) repeat protein
MPRSREPVESFAVPPDPGRAVSLDDLVERLRLLKVWAGDPSYESIKDRINAAWTAAGRPPGELARRTTVADCFRPGRQRLNTDLVLAVVRALHPDVGYVTQWGQALRVVGGETRAASQVRVQDTLPPDLPGFTGRTAELDRLREAVHAGRTDGGTVVISAIEGMAGVGKTRLAVHAGHLLHREQRFERVLFVNLRGFHPDAAQPPADPAAVLDGFLRLLGVPGPQVPHDLDARASAYRDRLAGTRALVLLDNAADEEQLRPLIAGIPGCFTLVTSRRRLAGLSAATRVAVDVFTPEEALDLLNRAEPSVPLDPDPGAAARIARRCGYLPLALGLVTGHINARPGWTLTDHADRLDERHDDRRLDSGVELAFDLSCHRLPDDERRLLRLTALHPGNDFDAYAAAALSGTDLPTARAGLRNLSRDNLLQQAADRYSFHDLIRAYAAGRAGDEDSPRERGAALTRLDDHYRATAAAAMDTLHPAESHYRPRVPPAGTPAPDLSDPAAARTWLDTERPTLVAVTTHAARDGRPAHAVHLSAVLQRYLDGGHHADALTVHGHAREAARLTGDPQGEAQALFGLGATHLRLSHGEPAGEHLRAALALFRRAGDLVGQARTLATIGHVDHARGRYGPAGEHYASACDLAREAGDLNTEARALINLGFIENVLGRPEPALDRLRQALGLFRELGNRSGEAYALNNLGNVEQQQGMLRQATAHQEQALTLFRDLGDRAGEAWTLDSLGAVLTLSGQPERAGRQHRRALTLFQQTGEEEGQVYALNGLGEAAHGTGDHEQTAGHHLAALAMATDLACRDQQARAHAGIARARRASGDRTSARHHYRRALELYTELGLPESERIRDALTAVETRPPGEGGTRP